MIKLKHGALNLNAGSV